MAIFRTGPLIGAISGNLGGVCFVQTKAGPVIRKRNVRTRNDSKTAYQRRQTMRLIRIVWRDLTEDQRTSWRQTASQYPHTNRLGVTSRLSGYQFFHKWMGFIGTMSPSTVPDFFKDPPSFATKEPYTVFDFAVDTAGAAECYVRGGPAASYYHMAFFGARTFSTAPRKSWFDFRFISWQTLPPGYGPDQIDIDDWLSVIGPPGAGEQCWLSTWQFTSESIQTHHQVIPCFAA